MIRVECYSSKKDTIIHFSTLRLSQQLHTAFAQLIPLSLIRLRSTTIISWRILTSARKMKRVKMGLLLNTDMKFNNLRVREMRYHFTLKRSSRRKIGPCSLATKLFLTRSDINWFKWWFSKRLKSRKPLCASILITKQLKASSGDTPALEKFPDNTSC